MSVPIVTLVGRCAVTSPDAATRWRRRRSHSGGFATREWFPTPETRDARKTGRTLMRTSRFRSNRWLVAAATVVSLTALTACGSSDGDSNSDPNAIVVGSANFTESETIANIYAEALRVNGFDVSTSFNVGSREAYIPALKDGSISVIPDYTGNLLQYLDPDSTATSSADVLAALPAALGSELAIATPASAEDKDAVVVTKETADKWNLKTIADLAPHSAEVKFGAPAEFQERPAGLPGLKSNYGLDISA
eukprot:gene21219-25491_t